MVNNFQNIRRSLIDEKSEGLQASWQLSENVDIFALDELYVEFS